MAARPREAGQNRAQNGDETDDDDHDSLVQIRSPDDRTQERAGNRALKYLACNSPRRRAEARDVTILRTLPRREILVRPEADQPPCFIGGLAPICRCAARYNSKLPSVLPSVFSISA